MALTGNEVKEGGFVRAGELGPLVVTTETLNAKPESGFLRDPDGRLVVSVVDTSDPDLLNLSGGFLRDPETGALILMSAGVAGGLLSVGVLNEDPDTGYPDPGGESMNIWRGWSDPTDSMPEGDIWIRIPEPA